MKDKMKDENTLLAIQNLLEKITLLQTKHDLLNLKSEVNSHIATLFKSLKNLSVEEKRIEGEKINVLKVKSENAFKAAFDSMRENEIQASLAQEEVDITLPSFVAKSGSLHPVSFVINELVTIMQKYGFAFKSGPEIETNYYNFDALNIKKNHPAREMHDTFYLDFLDSKNENFLLRTHTSSVQVRGMEGKNPPFAFISAGRTYRCDFDKTHTPMFNQLECLYIEEGVHMGNLTWMIDRLFNEFFTGINVKWRLRPSFFPFTTSSIEVDIDLGNGFLEVMGAGMIHPNVLKNCGIDSEKYSGFAFGTGIERLTMIKYGISDLRDFFNANKVWNKTYGLRA